MPDTAHLLPPVVDEADASPRGRHLVVADVPGLLGRLRCRFCGLAARDHGRHLIHRFLRPSLPDGYRYLDQVETGDVVRLASGEPVLLQGPRHDCDFLLDPSTVVAEVG